MKTGLLAAIAAIAIASPVTMDAASAQRRDGREYHQRRDNRDHNWQGDTRNWDPSSHYAASRNGERRLSRNDRIYKGRDGRAYCRRNDGTTGLVVGALGGGVLGNLIGGGTLGTLLGAGGGAVLGRSIDRGNVKCR